jgi:hypothetical protein
MPPPTGTYGSGIAGDSLFNTQIGGTDCGCAGSQTAYRFQATHTGQITGFRVYLQGGSGYGAGTGGTLAVSLQADPFGTTVGSTSFKPGALSAASLQAFSLSAPVTAGSFYDLVFKNSDPSPKSNFVSVNAIYTTGAQAEPGYPNLSQLLNNGSSWSTRAGFLPIYDATFSDGFHQGQGYMEVWVGAAKAISGSSEVREQFTASRTVTVTSVDLRAKGSAVTASLAGQTATVPLSSSIGWATGTFSAPVTLVAGQSYALTFTSTGSASAYGIERGSGYSFNPATFFSDGYGQYTTGSSWSGLDQPGGSKNNTNADLQFWLH